MLAPKPRKALKEIVSSVIQVEYTEDDQATQNEILGLRMFNFSTSNMTKYNESVMMKRER